MFYLSVLLFISYALRLWISAFYGLHPDEAYYFVWSKHLALGYFDHPPMVAWMIALGSKIVNLFISEETLKQDPVFYAHLTTRMVPTFFSGFVTPLVVGQIIENVQKLPLRVSQMIILLSSPVFLVGPLVVTPDAPFVAGWAFALLLTTKFLMSRANEAWPGEPTPFHLSRAIRMGVVLAFCAYSKYSAIFAAFLFVITGSGLYNTLVAGSTALLLTFPHFIWMYLVGKSQNAGILFQLQNGLGQPETINQFKRAGDLLLSQFVFWTPMVFLALFYIPLRNIRRLFVQQKNSQLIGTLFLWAAVPLVFFALTSLKRPAEANWPMIGFIPAIVLLLTQLRRKYFSLYFLLFTQILILIIGFFALTNNRVLASMIKPHSPNIASKLEQPSRIHEFQDWDKLHEIVSAATRSRVDIPVVIYNYQTLSELLFEDTLANGSKKIGWDRFRISPQARRSQFNLLPQFEFTPTSSQAYWLITGSLEGPPPECRLYQTVFKSPTELKTYLVHRCSF